MSEARRELLNVIARLGTKGEQTAPDPDGYTRCSFCGMMRPPHEFEDGLRCVLCAEEQDADPWYAAYFNARAALAAASGVLKETTGYLDAAVATGTRDVGFDRGVLKDGETG